MKIVFLIPPSEAKKEYPEWKYSLPTENLSFNLEKPLDIAWNVTEKDLKCSWKRFEEGVRLNKKLCNVVIDNFVKVDNFVGTGFKPVPTCNTDTITAINRYSWVMFNAIDYKNMSKKWSAFFEQNFLILSWMYGILKPLDTIWNYKLPIDSKWLFDFWWDKIIREINSLRVDYVINLLPLSYSKLIVWKNKKSWEYFNTFRNFWIININFVQPDWKKISHWVKKIKWKWIKNMCEKAIDDYNELWGEVAEREEGIVDVNIRVD